MIAVTRRVIESLRLWPLPVLHSVRPISPLPSFDTAVNSWKLAGVRLHTRRITVRLQFDRFFGRVIDSKLRQQPCRENTHGSCIFPGSARSDVTSSIFRQRVRRDEEIVAWQPIDLDRLLYRSWSPTNVAQGVWLSRQGAGLKAEWDWGALKRKLEKLVDCSWQPMLVIVVLPWNYGGY